MHTWAAQVALDTKTLIKRDLVLMRVYPKLVSSISIYFWYFWICQVWGGHFVGVPRKVFDNHVVVAFEPYLHACLQITGWHILTLAGP